MRYFVTWWWVIALCAVAVPVMTLGLAGNRLSQATAKVRLHEQDTTVAYGSNGEPQPYTRSRSVNELTKDDFVDGQVAAAAARRIQGVSATALERGLRFTPLTGTDVELAYTGGGSTDAAAARLTAYVDTLVAQRIASQRKALTAVADRLRTTGRFAAAINRLDAAAQNLDQQIYRVGAVTSSKSNTIPRSALLAGGLAAGIILGLLAALVLGKLDPRIRRPSDLRALGLRAFEVDPLERSSVETLRAIVEVAGGERDGAVVAVTTPGNDDSGVAEALAFAFARTGRPTTRLDDHEAARSQEGTWAPASSSGQHLLETLPRLRGVLASARPGEVTVIDAPGVVKEPHALIASAAADVTVLCLRRGRNTWKDLEASLELLEDAVLAGRVRITLERRALLHREGTSVLSRAGKQRRDRVGSYS